MTGRCIHCGFPVRLRGGDRAEVDPAQIFCCYGCAIAWRIAGEGGGKDPSGLLARLGLAAFLTMNVMGFSLVLYAGDPMTSGQARVDPLQLGIMQIVRYGLLALTGAVFALLGAPILRSGLADLCRRGAGVDTLIALGVAAAFGLSAWATVRGAGGVYFETVCMVLVLVTAGRWLEARARVLASDEMKALLRAAPRTAHVLREGRFVEIADAQVRPGELVRIAPGAVIPVDGTVTDGRGGVDESSLTGESMPVPKSAGSSVLAGTTSVDGALLVRATASGEDRLEARIARRLEEARDRRAPIELLADRVAGVFTPIALAAALATAIWWGVVAGPGPGLMKGLSVLLIACPCALGLATPLAVQEGLARCARRGILLRGGDALERLARIRAVFFDKTGTLTSREPRLGRIVPAGNEDVSWTGSGDDRRERRLLAAAAAVEEVSDHPLACAIHQAARERDVPVFAARGFRVFPGAGVEAEVEIEGRWRRVAVGGEPMLRRLGGAAETGKAPTTAAGCAAADLLTAFVVVDGCVAARLEFSETLRDGAEESIRRIRAQGLRVEILTGDRPASGEAVGRALCIVARGGLSSDQKLDAIAESESSGAPAAMVGEGVNDAPALAGASLSIALGGGDALARDASDVTLLRDDLSQVPWLLDQSRRVMRRIRINLFWAFAYNAALIPLAMAGRLQPILASLAMVASSLFVVGGSLAVGRASEPAAGSADGERRRDRVRRDDGHDRERAGPGLDEIVFATSGEPGARVRATGLSRGFADGGPAAEPAGTGAR